MKYNEIKLYYSSLKKEAYTDTPNIKIEDNLIENMINHFLPDDITFCKAEDCVIDECESRCKKDYWVDHGELTRKYMEHLAVKVNKDMKLYGQVGYVHDIDYLKYPHDNKSSIDIHPFPLVKYLMNNNIHPYIGLAILEHAAYLGLYKSPTSRLSAALSACEDLATLVSIRNNEKEMKQLSKEALLMASKFQPKKFIDQNIETPRVLKNIDTYINEPLSIALDLNYKFEFDI
jgi:predicted hydrolase (HD superfamily)